MRARATGISSPGRRHGLAARWCTAVNVRNRLRDTNWKTRQIGWGRSMISLLRGSRRQLWSGPADYELHGNGLCQLALQQEVDLQRNRQGNKRRHAKGQPVRVYDTQQTKMENPLTGKQTGPHKKIQRVQYGTRSFHHFFTKQKHSQISFSVGYLLLCGICPSQQQRIHELHQQQARPRQHFLKRAALRPPFIPPEEKGLPASKKARTKEASADTDHKFQASEMFPDSRRHPGRTAPARHIPPKSDELRQTQSYESFQKHQPKKQAREQCTVRPGEPWKSSDPAQTKLEQQDAVRPIDHQERGTNSAQMQRGDNQD